MDYKRDYMAVMSDNYIAHKRHSSKGWTKKGHKYIDRYWKNGRWIYIYRAPNKADPIELGKSKPTINNSKDEIKNATEEAYKRYKDASDSYNYMALTVHASPAILQKLKTRRERLYSDYEKTKNAEKEVFNEIEKLNKRKTLKEYVSDAKSFLGSIEGTLRSKSLKEWLGEAEAKIRSKF